MMSENKSYRVEYHFPRKCRSTNKKKMAGLLTRIKLSYILFYISFEISCTEKKSKQTNTQSNKQQPQKFEEIQQRANRVIRIWSYWHLKPINLIYINKIRI